MKTRRNRKGGGPFSFFGSKPVATPVQTMPEATLVTPVQTMPEATMATPVPDGKEMPEAKVSPEAQLLTPTPSENPSGNPTVDKAVADLYDLKPEFQNYHMRGIINAIGVCNSTEKMQNNAAGIAVGIVNSVPNAFGRGYESKIEMTQCGSQCKARSEKVKAALKELLRIGEGNDALGYIGSGRVAVNSAGYLGNSAVSLFNRGRSLLTPRAPVSQVAQEGQVAQAGQGAQAGGRRRTRRR